MSALYDSIHVDVMRLLVGGIKHGDGHGAPTGNNND